MKYEGYKIELKKDPRININLYSIVEFCKQNRIN